MIDLLELTKYMKYSKSGDKILYLTDKTGWSNRIDYKPHIELFRRMHESGEFDFIQKKIKSNFNIGIYEHYAIRRKSRLVCNQY